MFSGSFLCQLFYFELHIRIMIEKLLLLYLKLLIFAFRFKWVWIKWKAARKASIVRICYHITNLWRLARNKKRWSPTRSHRNVLRKCEFIKDSYDEQPIYYKLIILKINARFSSQADQDEMYVDGVAVGTDCMFIFSFIFSFFFNWIGFFVGYCILMNLAGRYGAMTGLGLSFLNALFFMKVREIKHLIILNLSFYI